MITLVCKRQRFAAVAVLLLNFDSIVIIIHVVFDVCNYVYVGAGSGEAAPASFASSHTSI